MDKQSKKWLVGTLLLALVIVLLSIASILLWQSYISKHPPTKEIIQLKKEEPAELTKIVLRSSLAGTWYSADAETLAEQIEAFFQKAQVKSINDVIALILPHAGYQYSGQTAACGLKTTNKKYERIIIIGPSHRIPMEEILSVPRVTHYETPLGQIPLDVELINKLLKYSIFQNVPQAHKYEHSVQIELPLLQYGQKDFKLVPIVAGSCSLQTIDKAGNILKSLVDAETLVIISSDFVHFGSNFGYAPFKENIPEQIKELDMGAYEYIAGLDAKGFLEYKYKTGATICGYVPIAVLLSMLDEPVRVELRNYTTSGKLTDDFTNSVSYLSIAFSGSWQNNPEIKPQANNPELELTEEDKKQLLTLARKTIVYALRTQRVPQASELGVSISDAMSCPRAAFVTLKKHSQLRGCIGDIFPQRPLYKSVIRNAINACVNDRRFLPVTEEECNDITIEISALTAPEPVASSNDIRIGIDGVVLSKDGRSAVFLPQVAPEQGWDVNQMLTQLSLKAQLPADAWKEGASFLVFQADVFGESHPSKTGRDESEGTPLGGNQK
ncbi:MAG TPA: AmmeMemoRadiSam system protein B [Sedimentisphaerales bacterium]|nr:AmmeMemoRadiSam system protein B [Sedimentisphaerales bacterium]